MPTEILYKIWDINILCTQGKSCKGRDSEKDTQEGTFEGKSHQARRQFQYAKTALLAIENQSTKQENGNLMDFFWNTYGKRHVND